MNYEIDTRLAYRDASKVEAYRQRVPVRSDSQSGENEDVLKKPLDGVISRRLAKFWISPMVPAL